MAELEGSVALVTGGGSGIGEASALALARRGCRVFIAGRTEANLKAAVERISVEAPGSRVDAAVADIADAERAEQLVDDVIETAGRLDVLVNAAASSNGTSVLEMTAARWDATMNVALRGTALCSVHAARHMAERGSGRVIMITSIDQNVVEPGAAHYCAAKAGLAAFARALAVELGASGVTVNSIAPGWVRTPMAEPSLADVSPAFLERLNALGRVAEPSEIAGVVAFLALDAPPFLTGETIVVDGAQTIKAAMP